MNLLHRDQVTNSPEVGAAVTEDHLVHWKLNILNFDDRVAQFALQAELIEH